MENNLEVTDIEKDIEDAINEEEVVSEEETSTDKVVEEETVDSEDGIEEAKKTVSEEDPEDEEDKEDEDGDDEDEDAPTESKDGKKKGYKESKKMKKEDLDVQEHIDAMLSGQDLSEEFQTKAKTIFEAAVLENVNSVVQELEEEFETDFANSVTEVRTEISEKVDEYLTYVAKEWLEENKLAVESGLKLEIMDNFVKGLKTVFTENYIEIPESKVDLYAESVSELSAKETELNESIAKNIELRKEVEGLQKDSSIREVTEGLTMTQQEKIRSLSEGVEFVSVEDFGAKLQVIRDNYFPTESVVAAVTEETLTVEESVEMVTEEAVTAPIDSNVARYAAHLGRFSKK
jgi:hypothetical protein|tara:strand:+ start:5337 stop:6377 length:1041 start_codon:yes stop_codon:yes gene_type:complete